MKNPQNDIYSDLREIVRLSDSEIQFFIEKGYLVQKAAVDPAIVEKWVAWCNRRIRTRMNGYGETLMPYDRIDGLFEVDGRRLFPRAWEAVKQLTGGNNRIIADWIYPDGFVLNSFAGKNITDIRPPIQSGSWHIDGSLYRKNYRRFLDSSERALTAICCWTGSQHGEGATLIVKNSVKMVAKELCSTPEGIGLRNWGLNLNFERDQIEEVVTEAGDFIFFHPYLIHSQANNLSTKRRIITPVTFDLKNVMCFNRGNDSPSSPLEQCILKALGRKTIPFLRTESDLSSEELQENIAAKKLFKEIQDKRKARGVIWSIDDDALLKIETETKAAVKKYFQQVQGVPVA